MWLYQNASSLYFNTFLSIFSSLIWFHFQLFEGHCRKFQNYECELLFNSSKEKKKNKKISLVGLSEDSSPALITKFDLCEMENFIQQHDIIVIAMFSTRLIGCIDQELHKTSATI